MKAQDIYDITMALIDEMKNDGSVDYTSTKDYSARTPGILTILQTEIIIELKKQGVNVSSLDRITKMEQEIELEDNICMGVLPYGLASKLLMQEDASLSNDFSSLYYSKLQDAVKVSDEKVYIKQVDREDVYDSLMRAGGE